MISKKNNSLNASPQKKQKIGMLGMLSVALGGTIGGPIFVMIGYAISNSGSGLLISLILNGFLMLLFVMIYSELALSLPIAGGGYSFSKEAVGGISGFLIGWAMWIGNILFAALSGIGFALSLSIFLPERLVSPLFVSIIGVIILLIFYFYNLKFPRSLNKLLKIFTFTILGGFLVYIIFGILLGKESNEDFGTDIFRTPVEFSSILSMTAYSFVFYCVYEWNSTFESLTAKFDEIKQPRKTIPRVFLFSIIIAIIIYWLVCFVTLLNLGSIDSNSWNNIITSQSEAPLADVFGLILGNFGIIFMGLIGIFATITSINSGIQMSTHLLNAMARDGFIPKMFKKEKDGVQWVATSFSCFLIILTSLIRDVELITEISNFIFLISMIILSISLILLRKTRTNLIRPWKVPFYPYTPIVAIILSGILIISMFFDDLGFLGIVVGIIILLIGVIYYLFQISRRDRIILLLNGSKIGSSIFLLLIWVLLSVNISLNNSELITINGLIYFIGIFGIFSLFFDIIPIRRILGKVMKDEERFTIGGITHHSEKEDFIARRFNIILGAILISLGIILFILGILFFDSALILSSPLIEENNEFLGYIFFTIFIVSGIIFILNGLIIILQEIEVRKIVEVET